MCTKPRATVCIRKKKKLNTLFIKQGISAKHIMDGLKMRACIYVLSALCVLQAIKRNNFMFSIYRNNIKISPEPESYRVEVI